MRTIKFRGKRLGNGVWIYGDLIHIDKSDIGIVTDYDHWQGCRVDPETVGQLTGLFDSNGKEIFEGDIVCCRKEYTFEVVWSNERVLLKGIDYHGYAEIMGFLRNEIEVIGNIHDNPKLLKGGDQ